MNSLEMKVEMKRNKDTLEKLAEALGLQVSGAWASEIEKIRERYNLSDADLVKIFFTSAVS